MMPLIGSLCLMPNLEGAGKGKGQGKGHGHNQGQGMPEEMRKVIHGLFDDHDKIERKIELTESGYQAITTSKDPNVAELLQKHLDQMEARLKSGKMVRRWDPAYEELMRHYDNIDFEITEVEGGISVVATGKNEDAVRVARNHASIISQFVEYGWAEHDKTHPAVLTGKGVAQSVDLTALGSTKLIHQTGQLFLASQPTGDDLKLASERGIKTVLSLRHEDELDFDERKVVENLGMRFVSLPWNGEEELTDRIFDQVRSVLRTAEEPMIVHCGSSNRVGGVWLPWRVLDQGVDMATAVKEAKRIGLSTNAYETLARAYIEKRKGVSEFSKERRERCLEIGSESTTALMKNLGAQLKAAMVGGDPVAAVAVCQGVAQSISQTTSREYPGVEIGRTSLKTRNASSNAPDATDRLLLTQWEHLAGHGHTIEPAIIPLHENAVRYYRPIFVKKECLTCHGPSEDLDGRLRGYLDQAYPADQARGYSEGDFRGAFRVEIDLKSALGN